MYPKNTVATLKGNHRYLQLPLRYTKNKNSLYFLINKTWVRDVLRDCTVEYTSRQFSFVGRAREEL
jgi:hypothetical protein